MKMTTSIKKPNYENWKPPLPERSLAPISEENCPPEIAVSDRTSLELESKKNEL